MSNLIIRADASSHIGSGHLMRCLALAQHWQDTEGQAIFVLAIKAPRLLERLRSEGMEVLSLSAQPGSGDDAIQTAEFAKQLSAQYVIVDGYQFGSDYQRIIRDSGSRLLFIDDNGQAQYYPADLVLNQNIYAHESLYHNRGSYTQLLLGTRYALLRREFLKWRKWSREIPKVARNILVTLGGSDPDNITGKVIEALQQLEPFDMQSKVVVGPANPHLTFLRQNAERSRSNIQILTDVADMADLMAWADIAVSGAGSTCWELALMRLPSLLIALADNQHLVAKGLGQAKAGVNLGWHQEVAPSDIAQALTSLLTATETRKEMARCGQELVDGEGAARALSHLIGESIRLRPVNEDDCQLLWEWSNELDARASSFTSDPIPWQEHLDWFSRKLQDPRCFIYIALDSQDTPVGQVRFDLKNEHEAVTSVSLDKSKRGAGLGTLLISAGVKKIFRTTTVKTIHAFIKPDNHGSVKVFEKAGFEKAGCEPVRNIQALHYVKVNEG